MARFAKGIGILLLAAICFAVGAITAVVKHWDQPLVHVAIENDSGNDLSGLILKHASSSNSSTVTLPALKAGQSTRLYFVVAGEVGYEIEARFPDGQIATSEDGYVERGTSVHEVIGKSDDGRPAIRLID
ncbi:hypothetical protein G4G28_13100 [Massilia sp. Dwa41.01b]|uniref:hypothetical protein n=1 Tax=unclassified Massilia TaxID=2609279 RepID=UPI0016041900|nr:MULTISPECIES: hypothetical protein [unclassified Massilia]QNA89170.1 hypothetical protein G4G28_13100 [Massilia sp. Dwa41.01b]QNB00067.1 hypothetical protein G4G31_16650 [Massilia sp. Se16.2.3]